MIAGGVVGGMKKTIFYWTSIDMSMRPEQPIVLPLRFIIAWKLRL